MLVLIYNKGNPPIKGIISKYWPILDQTSATRPLTNQDIMVKFRKPESIRDILVRAKLFSDIREIKIQCNRPETCQYCSVVNHNGSIPRHDTTHSFYTIVYGKCQSNTLIYCLVCDICHIGYVGQTKNRILDMFQGHFFEIRNHKKHYSGKAFCQPWGRYITPNSQYTFWNTLGCPRTYQGPSQYSEIK